jgi:cytochrome P450
MQEPLDPIAAVTHRDPYPYYARLAAERPFHRDHTLGMWVAAGARAVEEVLGSDAGRVRPPQEPVPRALAGSPAGEIFRSLVRMNDGRGHCPFKAAVSAALASPSPAQVAREAAHWAMVLEGERGPGGDRRRLHDFSFSLSAYVLGSLLGAPASALPSVAAWTDELVRGFAPASPPGEVERCQTAAARLHNLFAPLARDLDGPNLVAALAREAAKLGVDDEAVVVANAVGFLSQAYEATAGLIGNTLVALGTHAGLRADLESSPALLGDVIQEVLRHDPPVQNTRRFAAHDFRLAGQQIQEGDVLLVVLAAANRDPEANPHPERFQAARTDRRTFTFGTASHACPGQGLAAAIAQAGVERLLLTSGPALTRLAGERAYRPSANVRIPLFPGRNEEGATP